MVNVSNIVCKTIGIAGMSAVVYDAYATAQRQASVSAEEMGSYVFEKSIAAERSNTNGSYFANNMQKKVANLRTNNPLVPVIGKTKGFIEGFLSSLGTNIIPFALSAMALGGKGAWQKTGAWGIGIYSLFQIAKEGFGLGKTVPVDK